MVRNAPKNSAIILFDGVCNFCNSSVRFVCERDPDKYFLFTSLQSEIGQQLLAKYQISSELTSVVLIENENIYLRSSAAIYIARRLTRLWPMMMIFLIIPRQLRDAIYDFIGKRRYQWFGKSEQCQLPAENIKDRFL